MSLFGEKKMINSIQTEGNNGSFALDEKPFRFESCRERFGSKWQDKHAGFFLKHNADHGNKVANFIRKTEEIMALTEFTRFSETEHNTILWLEPSNFWKSCRMRR